MKHWKHITLGLIVCFFLGGCHTLKGAQDGFKEDWKSWNETDGWIQENMW